MNYRVAFIAPYPTEENAQDGFIQRVKNIDDIFRDVSRVYLVLHFNPFCKRTTERVNEKLSIHHLHYRLDSRKIREYLVGAQSVYVHSLYGYEKARPYLRNSAVTLDLHGIVPEEVRYEGRFFSALKYSILEWLAVRASTRLVFVTNAMKNHFTEKYPGLRCEMVVFPIISNNTLSLSSEREDLKIGANKTVFIYSGNFQRWQRIDLVLEFLRKIDNENFVYLFLTKDKAFIESLLTKEKLPFKGRFLVVTSKPEDLFRYYNCAHFGFMVRDDHPLNRVANPTKMLEYLYYGIVPILKLTEIGDYRNFDFVSIENPDVSFSPAKSARNQAIARELVNANRLDTNGQQVALLGEMPSSEGRS